MEKDRRRYLAGCLPYKVGHVAPLGPAVQHEAAGRLSNSLGRRPVALATLAVAAAGCLILPTVHSVAPLIVGRILQGLASSALAAYSVDSAPASPTWLATAVTSGAP